LFSYALSAIKKVDKSAIASNNAVNLPSVDNSAIDIMTDPILFAAFNDSTDAFNSAEFYNEAEKLVDTTHEIEINPKMNN
jgi:hypothetical protein